MTAIIRIRRLLVAIAAVDFAALLAFLGLYLADRGAIERWVGTGFYAGMVRTNGLDTTVTYAVVSTAVVHRVTTGLFLWLAPTVPQGRTATRVRATVLLVVSGVANVVLLRSPVGGTVQQVVMGVSLLLKLVALGLLWFDPGTVTFYRRARSVRP
jgi:hypothetical protein